MGTNYYAHIIPTKERKKEIKDAVDADDFSLVRKLVDETYSNVEYSIDNEEIIGGKIHLGKKSYGWKFLWNPNIYQVKNGHFEYYDENGIRKRRYVGDPDTPYYIYPLTKEGIKTFIDREDIEIYDEYREKYDKEEFFKMALEWTTWYDYNKKKEVEAWDADSYDKEHPEEYKWNCRNEYTDFLESLGYKLSKNKSDFYSDGLRFATTTDFS